jgi:cycloeucalenol cycloisomerase
VSVPSSLPQFPYYTFVDRRKMYSIGSLFYAIYFFVSFPLFMRLDEEPAGKRWSLGEVRPRGARWQRLCCNTHACHAQCATGWAAKLQAGCPGGGSGRGLPSHPAHSCLPGSQVALDALAAGMLVTLVLDAWRITVGGIVDAPAAAAGLQWAAG